MILADLSFLIYINLYHSGLIRGYADIYGRYQDMTLTTFGYLIILFYFIRFSMRNYRDERIKVEKEGIKIKEINVELTLKNEEINNQYFELDKLNNELQESYFLISKQNLNLEILNSDLKKKNDMISEQNSKLELINFELENKNEQINLKNEELAIIAEQLSESNLTKDKFFSIIAHDLINPISGLHQIIKLFSEEFDTYSYEEKIEMLHNLQLTSWNTFSLLDNLLTWSRIQRNKLSFEQENFLLHDAVNLTINQLTSLSQNKFIIIKNSTNINQTIFADKNSIMFVIRNLISNAIKFTQVGGIIRITNELRNNIIEISVTDNGIGMNQLQIENLFKIDKTKSTQGTNNEKGTGLGLILCKEFVEKHRGRLWVKSEPGIGSTFSFTLPV